MEQVFPGDAYVTPPDTRHDPWDYLFFCSRWYLFLRFAVNIVLPARVMAQRGGYDYEAFVRSSFGVLRWIEKVGGRFDIRGLDNIRAVPGPVVFVGNHMSTLETLVLPCLTVPIKRSTFVVKDSLMTGAVFGPIMRSRDPVAVTRTDPREDLRRVMSKGVELLEQGVSIIIFPEGTRQNQFNPERFNSLGVRLAGKAGVYVVPFALKTDFWGNGAVLHGFGSLRRGKTIHFEFGKGLRVEGRGKREHKQIIEFIQERTNAWVREDD